MGEHHHHAHVHVSGENTRMRLSLAYAITVIVLIVELVGAALSGSLSLAADAGHMFVDSAGLLVALCASFLLRRPRTTTYSWGWGRSEIIAAALQAGMLFLICLWVGVHAIARLITPEMIEFGPMMTAALVGLIANILSALVLFTGRNSSLNMRAAFLEVATDALGSIAVIVAAIIYYYTGWARIDGLAALAVAVMMGPRAIVLLRSALRILMEATPTELDAEQVKEHFLKMDHVYDVHDLHISTIQTGLVSLTAHIAIKPDTSDDERGVLLHRLEECAQQHFHLPIGHCTFQFEPVEHSAHEQLKHVL